MTNLRSPYLYDLDISDEGLKNLEHMTELSYLPLSHTKVTDAGLEYLLRFQKLETLELDGTKISDAGLMHLAKFPALANLSVFDTPVTLEAIERLQNVLPNCSIHWGTESNPQRSAAGDPFR